MPASCPRCGRRWLRQRRPPARAVAIAFRRTMRAVPPLPISLRTVHPLALAAVRRELAPADIGSAWKPALDKVWAFVRTQPGLWTTGHNVFVYRRPKDTGARLVCDF